MRASILLPLLLLSIAATSYGSTPAGPFQYNGNYYYYNGGAQPQNNAYCLYVTPPTNAASLPVVDPATITGAQPRGTCNNASLGAGAITYDSYNYWYNGNGGYCLYLTPPANSSRAPIVNPQYLLGGGAVEQGLCSGTSPPAGAFTFVGNTTPANATALPILNPEYITGAALQGVYCQINSPAGAFAYGGHYYYYNGANLETMAIASI